MWTRSLYICCKKKKKHSSFLFISFISVDIILARISFPRVLYILFYIYTLHVVHWRLKNNSIKENDSYSIFLSPRWTFFRFICKCINDKMSVQCGIMTNEMNVDAEMSIHYPYSSKYHSTVWSMKQKTCFFLFFCWWHRLFAFLWLAAFVPLFLALQNIYASRKASKANASPQFLYFRCSLFHI